MSGSCAACDRSSMAYDSLATHGERQTLLRYDVLKALHHSPQPVGAYALFDQLHEHGRASAPPAVYRVLDFLVAQGLVHKLPTLGTYAACKSDPHRFDTCFAICNSCLKVSELTTVAHAEMARWMPDADFAIQNISVEVFGLCSECKSL